MKMKMEIEMEMQGTTQKIRWRHNCVVMIYKIK